jgi:hypothetical protein
MILGGKWVDGSNLEGTEPIGPVCFTLCYDESDRCYNSK